ncbi:hypothetical protein [Pseudonocardia adelaidensis]|uniref:Secreted protein n=1 Tax=Pseudonocardia adelaidensis TaxID=648754 RepID=A0ABP9NKT1_9PSEU
MKWATATALLGIASGLALGPATPAAADPPASSWSADLRQGEAAGVVIDDGVARIDPQTAFVAAAEGAPADGTARPTGLLTFPAHRLATATDHVAVAVDGEVPAGATATVDVRGRRATGGWTEWVPAASGPGGRAVTLPAASAEVQARLVLAGDPAAGPVVRGVSLTARPAPPGRTESDERALALSYRVFATREGLVGGKTANGHVIGDHDHFVALPSRRALSPRGSSDYSVKVCASGRCAFAPVWDVGPWNTRDDYWNPGSKRQEWRDLPQGVPQAQAAHDDGYNGGRDQYDREVSNPAGIDLGDGLFWDALGLENNAWVDVEYLWTGAERLARVASDTDVRAAPDGAAEVVGVAAGHASVPVECAHGGWLRVGPDQYVEAGAIPDAPHIGACPPPATP